MDLPVFHRAGFRQLPPVLTGPATGRTNLLHFDNERRTLSVRE
jgi:hypothetical protein